MKYQYKAGDIVELLNHANDGTPLNNSGNNGVVGHRYYVIVAGEIRPAHAQRLILAGHLNSLSGCETTISTSGQSVTLHRAAPEQKKDSAGVSLLKWLRICK